MKYTSVKSALLIWAVALAGCATSSQYEARINDVHTRYNMYSATESYYENAPKAMEEAKVEVEALDALLEDHAATDKVEQQLYLAERKLALVESRYETEVAKEEVDSATEKRQAVILDATERDLYQAEREAMMAKQAALSFAEQAAQAQKELNDMEVRAAKLESEVQALSTRRTERGLVLTLKDILFSFNKSELKSGYNNAIDQLASFLNEYPDRDITIEGYTDSVGSDEYNQQLSEQRAEVEKSALVNAGVDQSRIVIRGLGEAKPVASNDTEAGRQQNRRVEIVLENTEHVARN